MEKRFTLSSGALEVPCLLSEPEDGDIRRVVLGVHGICGSAEDEIQAAIAEEMDMFYAATLRFDFPAHGRSTLEGQNLTLDNCVKSLMAAAEFTKERYPAVEDLCIFATGFGAYITFLCLDELVQLPGSVKLVVQTPSVLMHETLLAMGRISQPTFQSLDKITFRGPRPLEVRYHLYEQMRRNIVLTSYPQAFLILHGGEDDFIPLRDIQQLRRLNERSKLVVLPGISHRFQEEGAWDMVLDLTRDWFACEQVLVTDWE